MRNSLYEFLILHKKLSLPGIGTIGLYRNSSQLDFTNKQFTSPSYSFKIESKNDKPSKKLYDWLCSSLGIAEWDAIKAVNDFSFGIKEKITQEGEMSWEKIGVFRRNDNGDITLESAEISLQSEQPVFAEKVIREKSEHTVLVGEQERTVVEMEEYFAQEVPKKNYGWIIALILTVLAIMFIGWYFSEKGFSPSSAGNQSVIKTN